MGKNDHVSHLLFSGLHNFKCTSNLLRFVCSFNHFDKVIMFASSPLSPQDFVLRDTSHLGFPGCIPTWSSNFGLFSSFRIILEFLQISLFFLLLHLLRHQFSHLCLMICYTQGQLVQVIREHKEWNYNQTRVEMRLLIIVRGRRCAQAKWVGL